VNNNLPHNLDFSAGAKFRFSDAFFQKNPHNVWLNAAILKQV
jgi:hypothetical protein